MAKTAPFFLSKPKSLALVRELAAVDGNVIFTLHALKRMRLRNVTPFEILQCLRKGVIVEGPALGVKGNWELALQRLGGNRKVRVAVAIDMPKRLIVITVYDEKG
jgi:Domain of unknown function (DUF4258)